MRRRIWAIALAGFGGFACGEVQRVTVDAHPGDAAIDGAPPPDAKLPIDAAPHVCKPPVAAGGIPDSTSKLGWGLSQGVTGSNDSGSTPGILVVGDSLVAEIDTQVVANAIRFFQGTSAVVVAAGGASVAHFNKESLIQAATLSTIQQYENFFGTVRITVVALGSNDARLITQERGQTGGYTVAELAHQIDVAIASGLSHSTCVVLINVANHWDIAAPAIVDEVNDVIGCAAIGKARVRAADWNSFSASHPEWFLSPTDIHHSDAGKTIYRDFIVNAVGAALASGC